MPHFAERSGNVLMTLSITINDYVCSRMLTYADILTYADVYGKMLMTPSSTINDINDYVC
jgi:hypothetical protein